MALYPGLSLNSETSPTTVRKMDSSPRLAMFIAWLTVQASWAGFSSLTHTSLQAGAPAGAVFCDKSTKGV